MTTGTLGAALEQEHREIDGGIEAFAAGLGTGEDEAEPLQRAMAALRRHIYLEEELLFPSMKQAGFMAPVFVMLREHGEIWRALDTLDARVAAGEDNDSIREACGSLSALLDAHNMKEEPVLYPRADASLSEAAAQTLAAFLETGRMPDGWICATARS